MSSIISIALFAYCIFLSLSTLYQIFRIRRLEDDAFHLKLRLDMGEDASEGSELWDDFQKFAVNLHRLAKFSRFLMRIDFLYYLGKLNPARK